MSGGPCPDCFSGFIHDGTPTGKITTIHGLRVYVAEPDDGVKPKGLIVIIHDAFGLDFVNNKILADRYAKRGGFMVYLPDFMKGHALSTAVLPLVDKVMEPASWLTTIFYKPFYVFQMLYHAIPWMLRNSASAAKPRVFSFFQALRTSPAPFPTNNLKIGAAGFCWGGKFTVLLAHNTPESRVSPEGSASSTPAALIDCGFTAHPSYLVVPADIDAVTVPLSIAVGDNDMALKGPLVVQAKELLEKKNAGDHEVVIIPNAKHGFAIRTNPKDQYQMECAEKAELQAIAWFERWMA